jgi:hypothetical protein
VKQVKDGLGSVSSAFYLDVVGDEGGNVRFLHQQSQGLDLCSEFVEDAGDVFDELTVFVGVVAQLADQIESAVLVPEVEDFE